MSKHLQTADDYTRKLARLRSPGATKRTQTTVGGDSGIAGGQSFDNPMTDESDLIVGGESGALTRLGVGTDGQVITVQADLTLAWEAVPGGHDAVTVTDSSSIDLTLTGQDVTAAVILEWLQDTVAAIFTGGSHTNITTTYQDAGGVIDLAASGGSYAAENARDDIAAALVAGNNIDITVNDGADTITIEVESLTSADITDFTEAAQDVIGALLADSTNIDFTYNDAGNAETVDLTTAAKTFTINFVIDGGGATITTGIKGVVQIDRACTIISNTLLADQSGSITITIKKSSYSGYAGSLTSIVASAKPTLSSAQKSTDATLTGWTTSVSAGDVLEFTVDTITTCQRVTLALKAVGS